MGKCGEATTAAIINFIQRIVDLGDRPVIEWKDFEDYDECQYNRIIEDVLK